jgi:hypothetical protein
MVGPTSPLIMEISIVLGGKIERLHHRIGATITKGLS